MAHEVVEAVYGRDLPAWHREGTVLPGLLTQEQVNEYVKWPTIATRQTLFLDTEPTGKLRRAKGFSLTVAEWPDGRVTPLGQVTSRWEPIQASHGFQVFDPVVQEYGAAYDAAGILSGGRTFWILAALPEDTVFDKKDRWKNYLLFTVSHDGTGAANAMPTKIRVVCRNTLSMALGTKGGRISIRHTGDIEAKVGEAREQVARALEAHKRGDRTLQAMFDLKLDKEARAAYITSVLGIDVSGKKDLSTRSKNILSTVARIFEYGRGARLSGDRSNLYHTFNTLTEYVDHDRTVKGGNGRLGSIAFGSGAQVKQKALALAERVLEEGVDCLFEKVDLPESEKATDIDNLKSLVDF